MASIRKRNSRWQAQIRRHGHAPITRTFGRKSDAEKWVLKTETELATGEYKPSSNTVDADPTLGDLVERYLRTCTPSKRSASEESYWLRSFLKHPICARRASQLRTQDFALYRDERLRIVKPSSVKRQLDPVRHLFELARHEWGLPLRHNPLARLKLSHPNNRRERRLRDAEEERLLEAASRSRNLYVHPIITLALETGMRRGEILGIRRQHIDTRNRTLLIPITKNGHARTIPLTPAAYALLHSCSREREGREGYLFPTTANAFRLAWERTRKRAGIEDLRFHDLRHEAISRFFEMGLTAPEVALISGHRDMRMLFRYTHPMQREIHRKLSDHRSC